jgi:hypothetical protein
MALSVAPVLYQHGYRHSVVRDLSFRTTSIHAEIWLRLRRYTQGVGTERIQREWPHERESIRSDAMPSMHVGWTTLGAIASAACLPWRLVGYAIVAIVTTVMVTSMRRQRNDNGRKLFLPTGLSLFKEK